MPAPLVFLAIVAARPDGWPLEVAWTAADLSAAESWRVRPDAEGPDDAGEETEAEAEHVPEGLEPERLERDGHDSRRIAARLAEDLADCTVAAAAPAEAEALLDRLYAATPLSRPFVLRDADGLRRTAHGEPDEADVLRGRAAAGLRPGRAPDEAAALALAYGLAAGHGDAATLGARLRRLLERTG